MKRLNKTPRQTRRRDGDTEQRILDAAHAVFVRRGTAGTRMQEIAAEAGVNQALLHYYFRNKEQLARAAFERAARGFMPAVVQVIASRGDLEDKVRRIIDLEIEHLSRAPYLPGYIIGEVTHHPERAAQLIAAVTGLTPQELGPRVLGALRRQIKARVAAGTMRPIAPESFIVNLMALCIFPFAVRPMIQAMLGLDDRRFGRFITRRRQDLPAFFLGALRP
ncbi:MAG TPA: helix-turn-helix domain-containing protein [Vicinamibacterales bacterium]|nr:helix-turn-helix domain-containing protein [Vicinamibacterales bacterium]